MFVMLANIFYYITQYKEKETENFYQKLKRSPEERHT